MTTNCSACRFYRGTSIGMCHRYPSAIKVASQHWCGEFASVDVLPAPIDGQKKSRRFTAARPLATSEDGNKL